MHIQDFIDYELHQETTKQAEAYLKSLHARYNVKRSDKAIFNWKFMTGYKAWFFSTHKNNDT